MNHNSLIHALFSIWLRAMYPCIEESTIMTGGTKDKNDSRMRLGRYPVTTWLTIFLHSMQKFMLNWYASIRYRCFHDQSLSDNTYKIHKLQIVYILYNRTDWQSTYKCNMPFKKGNKVSNWSKCVRPWTMRTGTRNRAVIKRHAKTTAVPQNHLLTNDAEKKGQYTSWGSGACSVSHSVGLTPCWRCEATAALRRDLNDTKAAGTSYKDIISGMLEHQLVS